jgi:SAM-dependent methyltransferase
LREARSETAAWPADGLERLTACPVCGDPRRELLYEGLTDTVWFVAPGRWTVHRCLGCSCAFLDPRPDRRTIGLAYSSYYTHSDHARPPAGGVKAAIQNGYLNARYGCTFTPASPLGRLVAWLLPKRRRYADRLVRHLHVPREGGRVLDVGCGDGAFLVAMRAGGWSVQGIEPDPAAAGRAAQAGVPVIAAPLEEAELAAESFDAVTLNHVLEHFHDPVQALRICRALLRPGGRLWIATPNLGGRGHAVFGQDWIGLDPPRHLVLFDRSALTRAVESAGFVDVSFELDYSAERTFPCSATVAAAEDPRDPEIVRRRRSRARVAVADVLTRLSPSRAEDLVLLARAGPSRGPA